MVQFSPLQFHVHSTLATDWTLVRYHHEILVTFAMHVVAARHAYDLSSGREHLIQTKRTWPFCRSLDACVCRGGGDRDADIALLTMHEILSQSFTQAADTAIVAVVDPFVAVVIP